MSHELDWTEELGAAITVCDAAGTIVSMNARARATFGEGLVGQPLEACHRLESSRAKIRELLAAGGSNTYVVEKAGVKKLIHQAAFTVGGVRAGLVELSIVLPEPLRQVVR